MGEACRKFETPVTGGNVSFYNQSTINGETIPVYPTPTIGMLGLLENLDNQMTLDFKSAGQNIYMVGNPRNDINSSEYLRLIHDIHHSPCPYFDIDEEFEMQQLVTQLIAQKLVKSAHDISEGGLFTCLVESAMFNNFGFEIHTNTDFRKDAYLFGESQSRVVLSVASENEAEFIKFVEKSSIPVSKIGEVTTGNIKVDDTDFGQIADWKTQYDTAIENRIK